MSWPRPGRRSPRSPRATGTGSGWPLLGAEAQRLGAATVAVGLPHEVAAGARRRLRRRRARADPVDPRRLTGSAPTTPRSCSPPPARRPPARWASAACGTSSRASPRCAGTGSSPSGSPPPGTSARASPCTCRSTCRRRPGSPRSRPGWRRPRTPGCRCAGCGSRHLTAAEVGQAARLAPSAQVVSPRSAPGCGWATAARCARTGPCSTSTGCAAATGTATASGGPRAPAGCWSSRGGTAHGVALSAPTAAASARQRAVAAGTGALEAAGRGRCRRSTWPASSAGSPSRRTCSARCCCYPVDVAPPAIGDRLAVDVRMTTARFDEVLGL